MSLPRLFVRRAWSLLGALALLHCGNDVYQISPQNHLTAIETGSFVAQGLTASQVAFNGSMAELAGQRYMAFRVDAPLDAKRQQQQLAFVAMDADHQPLGPHHILATPIGVSGRSTAEDPRLFVHDGGLYIVYNAHPVVQGTAENRRLFLGRIALNTAGPVPTGQLAWARQLAVDAPEFKLSKWEKNWTPFSHAGAVHLIYRTNPPSILRIDPSQLQRIEREALASPLPKRPEEPPRSMSGQAGSHLLATASLLPPAQQLPLHEVAGQWRGGTPAIYAPELGEFVAFFHTRCLADYNTGLGKRQYYLPGFYTFSASAPFAISRYVPRPLLIAEPQHHPAGWTRIVFPAGVVDDADSYLVSYGKDDAANGVARFDKKTLFALLVPATENIAAPVEDANGLLVY